MGDCCFSKKIYFQIKSSIANPIIVTSFVAGIKEIKYILVFCLLLLLSFIEV